MNTLIKTLKNIGLTELQSFLYLGLRNSYDTVYSIKERANKSLPKSKRINFHSYKLDSEMDRLYEVGLVDRQKASKHSTYYKYKKNDNNPFPPICPCSKE